MKFLKWILQKRHYAYVLAVVVAGTVLASNGFSESQTSAQGTNSIYLTPASGSYAVGANFTVSIRVNTADQVNAVGADLSYSSNLQYISIDGAGSAFGIDAGSNGGSGSVNVSRGNITAVSGDQLVSKVTFKVLAAGTGTVSMNSSSQALSSTTNQNVIATRSGGSYTLQGAATPTPPPATPPATPPTTPPATPPAATAKNTTNLPKTTIATQGNPATTPLPGDSVVELSAPATVETTGDGAREIAKVEYIMNGKVVSTDSAPPYAHNIDTTKYRNGTYSLTSKTYYKDGRVDSSKVSLIVKNSFGLAQLWLQLRHYAWLIIILLIIAGELFYLKFIRGGRGSFKYPTGKSPSAPTPPHPPIVGGSGSGMGNPVVGGGPSATITPSSPSATVITPTEQPKA